jgi:hypothetical protein
VTFIHYACRLATLEPRNHSSRLFNFTQEKRNTSAFGEKF